jgi:flagellar motility protein MotE (MotC chaperone)
MGIKKIIMLLVACLVSLGVSFGATWFIISNKDNGGEENATMQAGLGGEQEPEPSPMAMTNANNSMTEKRLEGLMHDVSEKMREYNQRDKEMEQLEERLAIVKGTLDEDLDRMQELQEKLTLKISDLKEEHDKIRKSMVVIDENESKRFKQLAAIYDKMDETQAAGIITNMMANNQLEDAVKIIYFMSERKAAKLLGEVSVLEPKLGAVLCDRLKRVKDEEGQ